VNVTATEEQFGIWLAPPTVNEVNRQLLAVASTCLGITANRADFVQPEELEPAAQYFGRGVPGSSSHKPPPNNKLRFCSFRTMHNNCLFHALLCSRMCFILPQKRETVSGLSRHAGAAPCPGPLGASIIALKVDETAQYFEFSASRRLCGEEMKWSATTVNNAAVEALIRQHTSTMLSSIR